MIKLFRAGNQPLYLEKFLVDHAAAFSDASGRRKYVLYDMNGFFGKFVGVDADTYFPELPASEISVLANGDGLFILDYSGEGTRFLEEFAEKLHYWLNRHSIDPGCVFFCQQNVQWPIDYAAWADKEGVSFTGRIHVVFASAFMHRLLIAAKSEGVRDQALGFIRNRMPRAKKFLSFNHGPTPHRVMIVRYLLQNARSEAYFSIGTGKYNMNEALSYQLVRDCYLLRQPQIAAKYPFYNEYISLNELSSQSTLPRPQREMPNDFDGHLYGNSYVSLVNESEMFGIENTRFTEKSIKPFLFGQIALFSGSPYLLTLLKKLGLQTFSSVLDESYDTIVPCWDRMLALLNEIDRLNKMPITAFEDLYNETGALRYENYLWANEKLLGRYESWLETHLTQVFANPTFESYVNSGICLVNRP